MTVTTGGRGCRSALVGAAVAASKDSGSSSFAAFALWPISSTRIIALSWSSAWLMVAMVPSFISALMTSAALTDMRCARAEAFAEYAHKLAREAWGFGRNENLAPEDLIRERYRGIRPAAGYPALPDH